MTSKLILSLDLSLNLPAYAVSRIEDGEITVLEVGHVDNKKGGITTAEKLEKIYNLLKDVFQKYKKFDVVVREKGFSRFANTTQLLFRVVGVSDLVALQEAGIKAVEEIPPTTIKTIVAGYSRADKQEVEAGVREYLSPEQKNMSFYSDDESDAIAVAITYAIKKGWLR
ncbi:crossover junction endodeoxyribonuclease RuvC [Clostridium perfringens]|uniref:crossover junction endodeoxyribonuclease RuvC n=1 Tax=Clostridium perfringens TaxID=1502 RepID=UPI002978F8B0|nr:crossover junction endodeoxyribonuclease RuvC [Clostridium perfringens]MDK0835025.1 crossover junction endodeoxyribonuclease RuvC [Clostridium perfringens]MDK0928430.1 crossover junction endodeoxyribonuclease RuvC [Clostridium perfringens]MDM0495346.1 crossover junction endodeoxyribonuclease RuvC [Clostridium perfringens]MDM0781062.1 crossover junction endodeoxyribonuclease RuvC [Clostridium perfringens]